VLLFSAGDVVKQTAFIDEKPDPQEQRIAREQLQQMVHFAECGTCRRVELLRYFSEEWPEENCGACDNCLLPRETFDGTLAAQKFLSCVYRVRQKSGFGFGLNHIVEVLVGAMTENIRKWGHETVSAYGIGKEMKRTAWQAIGRELVRLRFLRQSTEALRHRRADGGRARGLARAAADHAHEAAGYRGQKAAHASRRDRLRRGALRTAARASSASGR
jgi:ATP-dependent DNA helicase RecQ